jgi:hypothetical protein
MVGTKGLEPSRVASLAPKASVSTKSTTSPWFNRCILLNFAVKDQLDVAVILLHDNVAFIKFW